MHKIFFSIDLHRAILGQIDHRTLPAASILYSPFSSTSILELPFITRFLFIDDPLSVTFAGRDASQLQMSVVIQGNLAVRHRQIAGKYDKRIRPGDGSGFLRTAMPWMKIVSIYAERIDGITDSRGVI